MVKLTDESRAFHYGVYSIVFKIPPGKVTSYGHIAYLLDKPQNSRQVGSSLKHCSMIFQDLNQGFDPREEEYLNIENLPWWRVLASSGKISERGNSRSQYEQADRLRNEHVNVSDNHFVDLDEFGWFPDYVDLS